MGLTITPSHPGEAAMAEYVKSIVQLHDRIAGMAGQINTLQAALKEAGEIIEGLRKEKAPAAKN